MRILVVALNVGRTAPGIIFERLIQGLSTLHHIDVLTADYDPSIDLSNVHGILVSKKNYVHPRIHKFLISSYGIDFFDCYWACKSSRLFRLKKFNNYSLVLSFLSNYNYGAVIVGNRLAKKYKCKYAIHSIDAVPAPGWPEDSGYFKGVGRFVSKFLSKADALFSANNQMLTYQLSTFNSSNCVIKDVIYSPTINSFKILQYSDVETNYFVYTGGIYGARKANYLLGGFEKLLEFYPDSYVVFVGSQLPEQPMKNLKESNFVKN